MGLFDFKNLFVGLLPLFLQACGGLELQEITASQWTGHALSKRHTSALDFRNYETFLWQAPDGRDTLLGNFTVHTPGDNEHILAIEKFKPMLRSVHCSSTTLTLSFIDDATFAYAKQVWNWVNGADDHAFLMVVGAGDCPEGNPHRYPYLVSSLHYDEAGNVAKLVGKTDSWKNLVHAYELNVGTVTPPPGSKVKRADEDSTVFSIEKRMPFEHTVKTPSGYYAKLECDNDCGIFGSLKIDFQIVWGVPEIIDKALFTIAPTGVKVQAFPKLSLGKEGIYKKDEEWEKTILSDIRLYGIKMGPDDFLELGAFMDLVVGMEMGYEGQISISTGATARVPDTNLVIDFTELSDLAKPAALIPTIDLEPIEFGASELTGKVETYLAPRPKIQAVGLNFGYDAALELKIVTCELTLKSAQDNAGGVCDKGDDVTYAIKAEQKWAAKVEFEAGKVKDQPLEWTLASFPYPLPEALKADICIPLARKKDKGKPTTKPTAPSPTAKETTPVTTPISKPTPTCKNNANLDGNCISLEACKNLGGYSEPGHCPGPTNIQCCAQEEGVGFTCQANGVTGTCMPTASCPDGTGTSVPGKCPGPKDIQCCISKQHEEQATAKNLCTVDKSGLKTSYLTGECIDTGDCRRAGGTSTPGFCPGGTNNQCCTYDRCKGKPGVCQPVASCTDTKTPRLCPGGAHIQCCSKEWSSEVHPGVE